MHTLVQQLLDATHDNDTAELVGHPALARGHPLPVPHAR